jgi:hypothetical protein
MFWKCCAYIESKCGFEPCVGDASLQAKTPVAQHCSLTNYQNRDNCAALLQVPNFRPWHVKKLHEVTMIAVTGSHLLSAVHLGSPLFHLPTPAASTPQSKMWHVIDS